MLKAAKAGIRNLAIQFGEDATYSSAVKTVKLTIKKEKTKRERVGFFRRVFPEIEPVSEVGTDEVENQLDHQHRQEDEKCDRNKFHFLDFYFN